MDASKTEKEASEGKPVMQCANHFHLHFLAA